MKDYPKDRREGRVQRVQNEFNDHQLASSWHRRIENCWPFQCKQTGQTGHWYWSELNKNTRGPPSSCPAGEGSSQWGPVWSTLSLSLFLILHLPTTHFLLWLLLRMLTAIDALWISPLWSEVTCQMLPKYSEVKYFNPALIISGLTNIGPNSDQMDVNILLIRTESDGPSSCPGLAWPHVFTLSIISIRQPRPSPW